MNELSHWFPWLVESGVKVPETRIYQATDRQLRGLWEILDKKWNEHAIEFLTDVLVGAIEMGFPVFMRTGHTSAKFMWGDSCYLEGTGPFLKNVYSLIEWSAMQTPMLPIGEWVLREHLELKHYFTAFNGLPIANEWRYFIGEDGVVFCGHPYWPTGAVRGGEPDHNNWEMILEGMHARFEPELGRLSERVAEHVEGEWSLDWAQTKDGEWYAIDMAMASESWHDPDCPNSFGD